MRVGCAQPQPHQDRHPRKLTNAITDNQPAKTPNLDAPAPLRSPTNQPAPLPAKPALTHYFRGK